MTEPRPYIPFFPDGHYFLELRRPWKLATLSVGMLWLLFGALFYHISDWDVGISLIMGGLTYLLAPWSVTTIHTALHFRPRAWLLRLLCALVPAIFTVDSIYWLYHTAMGNRMIRGENFKVSIALYFICGLLWCYRGSLREMLREARVALRR